MKFLIAGLGNIGPEYQNTRHNIGFMMADALVKDCGGAFTKKHYGALAEIRIKNQQAVVLKPNTFMNLSGHAVRYWMHEEKIDLSHLLVLLDDIALPFGTLRMKNKGSSGGHNGLKNINELVGSEDYARLRFGIGHNFQTGEQIDYVLHPFTTDELQRIEERCPVFVEAVRTFCLEGVGNAMCKFNGK